MNIVQIIAVIILMLSGYPLGLMLAYLTKEELKQGKFFFKILMALSLLALIISLFFLEKENLIFFIAVMTFIFLITLANFRKAKNL